METRFERGEFVAVLYQSDGSSRVERFTTRAGFQRFLVGIEERLTGAGWKLEGSPLFLPDGRPERES